MNQIQVYVEDSYYPTIIPHKRPTLAHCGYTFSQLIKYIKEELYWLDINEEDITTIEIFNKKQHWCNYFEKESR